MGVSISPGRRFNSYVLLRICAAPMSGVTARLHAFSVRLFTLKDKTRRAPAALAIEAADDTSSSLRPWNVNPFWAHHHVMPFRRVNAWSRPVSPTMHERFDVRHRLATRNGGRHGGGCKRIATIVEPEREKSFRAQRFCKRANGQEPKRPRPEARRRRAGYGRTWERFRRGLESTAMCGQVRAGSSLRRATLVSYVMNSTAARP